MKKKPILERIGDFMAGKGFYIVLFLCVAAIGISGYYLVSTMNPGEGQTVSGNVQVTVNPSPLVTATPSPTETLKPSQTPAPTPTPTPAPTPTPSPTPVPTVAATGFTWPVKGEVIGNFSLEVLAYDQTMGDWRVHSALDIAAESGTQVRSIARGTVSAVFDDDLMGTTVVIDHGNGLSSIYANLAITPTVSAGDEVDMGEVIGSVGNTAIAESAKASHLHLEMQKDGQAVDPINYLPDLQ